MSFRIYQVDAFTSELFGGNPAAVCPLDRWLDDELLQNIAMENNLAETAFYVKNGYQFEIRWFTPTIEVDLCGHATLAAAFVLYDQEEYKEEVIRFYSPRSGDLTVSKKGELLTLNFPIDEIKEVELTESLISCFSRTPKSALKGKTDYVLVFENEDDIAQLIPSLNKIAALDARGVIATAKGKDVDFVSRFFAPQSGIDEDPVTGSAHTSLTPFWADQLGKTELRAVQLSMRRGYLECSLLNDRVEISGQAKLYLSGEIKLDL